MAILTDGVRTKFTDDVGLPLIGGQVFSYMEGTSTPKDTYQDRNFTIPNTNPIILDDVGSCIMYLKGGYRLRVLTAGGVLVEEKDNAFQSDGQVLDVVANTNAIAELKTNIAVLNARGVLKTDEHNHVIGQGKAESATVYDLSLRSDKVRVSAPTDIEFGDLVFKTYSVPTVANGVTIPAGTWLNPSLVTPLLGTAATKNTGTSAEQIPLTKNTYRAAMNASNLTAVLNTAYDFNTALPGDIAYTNTVALNRPNIGEYQILHNLLGHQDGENPVQLAFSYLGTQRLAFRGSKVTTWSEVYTSQNATKDPNGFLKGASPIAEIYSDKMDLNDDAQRQGGITFEKLGVGDYLVKGSLGFAQEGWYIETPKDANGNVLVAVVYKQLANNDISIKTYAKRFDEETGDIVPNLLKPRDIPDGRFISLRLHELPQEPPVMPVDTQPEI